MSRKLKYGEPTKTIGFKVPLSKEKEVKTLVENHLLKIQRDYEKPSEKQVKEFISIISNKGCGCIIENGLLKRAKNSKCKLNKLEH